MNEELRYSVLVFAALATASMARAQEEVPDASSQSAAVSESSPTTVVVVPQSAPSETAPVSVQPVVVTPQLSTQTTVPLARVDLPAQALSPASDAGLKSNANSGSGVQQIINLDTNSLNKNESSQEIQQQQLNDSNETEIARRIRMRQETRNDDRLLQKIEEDRLIEERRRAESIEGFSTQQKAPEARVEVIQVAPVAASPVITSETVAPAAEPSDSGFSLSPIGGYRWYQDSIGQTYRLSNSFVAGVNLEGRMNSYLSIEGSFAYGRDNIKSNYNQIGYVNPANYGYYGYGGYGYGYGGYGYGPSYNYSPTTSFYPSSLAVADRRDTYEVAAGLKISAPVTKELRPYIASSIGYLYQKYIYSGTNYGAVIGSQGLDTTSDYVLGNLGGGLDLKVATNVALGARFDYQALLNKNNTNSVLDAQYGDSENRYRLTGNLQIVF